MAGFRTWFTHSVLIAAIASLAGVSYGRPVMGAGDASAAEAIGHVETWIKNHPHPKDAAGYRVLARIHALAWAYGEKIPLVGNRNLVRGSLPRFTEDSMVLVSRTGPRERLWMSKTVPPGGRPERPVTADEAKHLSASIAAYRKAIELNAGDALSELGIGWMLTRQGVYARELPADYFGKLKPTDAEKATWTQAISQLSDKNYKIRDAASKVLQGAMPECVLMLRDVKLKNPEGKVRIDAILQGHFELQGLDHYRKAYALRAQVDLKREPNYRVDSQVSARAGAQILAALARYPEAAGKGEAQAVQDVVDVLAQKWQSLMMGPQ